MFGAGACAGAAFALWLMAVLPPRQLDTQVSVVQLGNLFVTICIALLIQLFFAQQYTEFRSEKQLVIDQCQKALHSLTAAKSGFEALLASPSIVKSTESQDFLVRLRALSNELFSIKDIIDTCEIKVDSIETVQSRLVEYRKAVTELGFPSRLPATAATDENAAWLDLRRSVLKVIVEVNRC